MPQTKPNIVTEETLTSAIFDVESDLFLIKCAVDALHTICEASQMDRHTSDAVYGLTRTIEDKREAVVHRLYFGFQAESPFHNKENG